MGKTSVQNVTQTTSNIGEAQRPYYNTGMQRAQALLTTPYQRYDQERIAGFTPDQIANQQNIKNMQAPGQFGQATDMANQAGLAALNAGNYDPTQFNMQTVNAPDLNMYQMGQAEKFGNEQAQQYMSPYFQNVLDIEKRKAQEDAQQTQLMANLGAASQGTYGGSRQLMADLMRERSLGQNMSDIQSKGQQAAYENAQQQFERDRAAGFNVNNANLNAALGVQTLGSGQTMQALLANQTQDLERQRLSENSRQFGAAQGLAGATAAGNMAQTLSNIGTSQQQADAQRLGLQRTSAAEQQILNQQYLTQHYQDFLDETNDPFNKTQQFMNLMSGVPQAKTVTETTSAPSPSVGNQILSGGLGAAAIYNTANRAGVL